MKRGWLGRDFHHKQLQNPFGRVEYYRTKTTGRGQAARILLLISALGWGYFLFFSSLFKIDNIIISNLEKIDKREVANLIWNELEKYRFLFLPQNNINVFNAREFIQKFNEKYFVEEIRIEKIYPKTINIFIKEKRPKALILNNRKDFYVDEMARIIEIYAHAEFVSSTTRAEHLTMHQGESLPIFLSSTENDLNIRSAILPKTIFDNLFFIKGEVLKKTNLVIKYTVYDPGELVKIIVKTGDGFEIYFDTEDAGKQLDKLVAFLQTKTEIDRKKIQYVDLRFGDRIYVK